MTWIVAAVAVFGTWANVKKYPWCFAVWMCTNGFWVVHNWAVGEWAQSGLNVIYFCLSVYGLKQWLKKGN